MVEQVRRVVFYTLFNTGRLGAACDTEAWTTARLGLWRRFTLPSILRQEHPAFEYWMVCDRSLDHLVRPHLEAIGEPLVRIVYDDAKEQALQQLPDDAGYALVRVDSDDLYHPSAAGHFATARAPRQFLQCNRGYAYDLRRSQLRRWNSRSSPFFGAIYREQRGDRDRWRGGNHTKIASRATVLPPGLFMVLCHADNTSTRFSMASGRLSTGERVSVLRAFGLSM